MADERVVIKIDVKSDDREIDRTRRKLERLARSESKSRRKTDRDLALASRGRERHLRQGTKTLDKVMRDYKRSFDSFDKMIKFTGAGMMKFLGLSAKMVALEMAGMGAAMVGIHLLFASGRLIMKAYHGMMKFVAGGMAGFAIAVGTVAAALREQQAAMYAFASKGQAKEFGSAVNQARVQVRALTMDADLAAVGVENLMAAYGEVAKNGKFTAASKNTLKGLMDFASAGMDMKKGTAEAGKLIATLQDTKKSYSEVVTAGKAFSPQLKKALEEYEKNASPEKKTKEALTAAIRSGELAKLGGVEGQFAGVSGTLINTLKAQFNLLRGVFADFGQQFIEPVKKESKEVFYIIKTALNQMNAQVSKFGKGGFIDKISDVVQKLADFTVRTMRDYLPGAMGLFQRIGAWWDRFVDGWNRILDYLRPFLDGARVIEGILKNTWLPIWDQIKEKMYTFNNEVQRYEPMLLDFGTKIGELIAKIMEYGSEVRKIFMEALPFINKVLKGFTDLIELFTSFLGGFTSVTSKLGGGMGSMGSVMMLIGLARGMKNTKGYFTQKFSQSGIREVADMNVRAGVVYVNGKPIAQYGAGVKGGSAGITRNSNAINTLAPGVRGPFMGPPGGASGAGGAGGFPSSGARRGTFVPTPYGRGQAGMGPNGGTLITSGPHKGKELLTQTVRGKQVQYMFSGRGTGADNYSLKNLTGQSFKSGVVVAPDQRMSGNTKIVDATGRIITRREQIARRIGEGQRAGSTAYIGDSRPKNFLDRFMGGGRNRGAGGFIGRAADRYRDRLVRRSKYLGPEMMPPPGATPQELRAQGWLLTSKRAYGPGTYNPNGLRAKYYNSRLYNNWLSPTSQLDGPLQPGRGPIGRLRGLYQGARIGSRNMRASRFGSSIFGNEAAGKKGFQGSATGTMGTMLGLGILSNYASEEAQGFLSAGSMIGMVNPLAGLAIGLGGTALTAKTAGGGAAAGAGAGAAIGTMIAPGFGTVAGAIIGAAVGGLMGRANRIKEEKKQAKQIMEGVFDQIIRGSLSAIQQQMMAQGFVGASAISANSKDMSRNLGRVSKLQEQYGGDNVGFVEALYAMRGDLGINITEEDRQKMLKQPAETAKTVGQVVDKQDALNKLSDIYQKRLTELTRMTGKSEQEVEKMAMELGVNLYDATTDFNTVLTKLGITVARTREQMRGMQIDMALTGLKQFEDRIVELNTPEILDEQARAFRDMIDAAENGIPDEKDMATFVKDFVPTLLNYVGGGLQGAFSARTLFGVGEGRGTAYTQEKGYFEGLGDLFTTGPFGELFQNYINSTISTGSTALGGDLNSILLGSGADQRFQIDAQKFGNVLSGMNEQDAARLTTAIQDGYLFADYDMNELSQSQIAEALNKYGVSAAAIGLRSMAENDELNLKLDQMPDDIKTTYEGIIAMFGDFFNKRDEKPDWMTAEFIKLAYENMHGDTYSPRGKGVGDTTTSRLSQTLSRHSAMDGALTGKRTMTSSYRTYGLGSINSDHITGRAYDLVGQNLGGYAKLVHANGGFAEFHGINANRHLHVVPGPGPYGETASPRLTSPMMSSGAGGKLRGDIYITQNIEAGPNATPAEVAKIAVREMKLALDNERQRA